MQLKLQNVKLVVESIQKCDRSCEFYCNSLVAYLCPSTEHILSNQH